MSDKVANMDVTIFDQDSHSAFVANMWDRFYRQMQTKREEWSELDSYLFATDTSSTSNQTLPWKNNTTLPKICQIRDNLHSNYMAALFPNDRWLTWQAHTKDSSKHDKARKITGYMSNKLREGNFRTTISRLVYDYIDKGNCFAMPSFERRFMDKNGERVTDFVGPKLKRISPYDIVFDPTAEDFTRTPKIVRSIKKLGDLAKIAQLNPEQAFWQNALERRQEMRERVGGLRQEDYEKQEQYWIDGFGSLYEYYQSDYVEVLEFYGDYYNSEEMRLETSRLITIVDRSIVVRNEPIPTYSGRAPIYHVGWRLRPDNLWAMGPLDNLVGLQYRLDHLENLKADAMDLVVHPPLKIIGEVEEFEWGPGVEVHIDEGGDVQEIAKNLGNLAIAQSEMQSIEDRMELYAGAPREAMGIRTPGEKTAFEFESLMTAAGRIFQEKATNFEINLVEPSLNGMLEYSHRNFEGRDHIVISDEDFGIDEFVDITKDDITANGVLRPIGARHFAQQNQDLLNLSQLYQTPLGEFLQPHTSSKELTKLVDNTMNLRGYKIFSPNIGILEQAETQSVMNTAAEDLQVEQEGLIENDVAPIPGEEVEEEAV